MAKVPPPPHAVRLILETGIALPEDRAQSVALLRHGQRLLAHRSGPAGDEFIRILHAVADRSNARHVPAQGVACRKGCALCCRSHVSVLAPEAFALARQLRGRARLAVQTRVAASAEASRTLDLAQRRAAALTCAFLVDDLCSVYVQRPLTCRMFASFDLTACQRTAAGGEDAIPQPQSSHTVRSLLGMSAYAAMRATGLPLAAYELSQLLEMLIARPELEADYYAGGDPFATLASARDQLDPGFIVAIDRLLADAGVR